MKRITKIYSVLPTRQFIPVAQDTFWYTDNNWAVMKCFTYLDSNIYYCAERNTPNSPAMTQCNPHLFWPWKIKQYLTVLHNITYSDAITFGMRLCLNDAQFAPLIAHNPYKLTDTCSRNSDVELLMNQNIQQLEVFRHFSGVETPSFYPYFNVFLLNTCYLCCV